MDAHFAIGVFGVRFCGRETNVLALVGGPGIAGGAIGAAADAAVLAPEEAVALGFGDSVEGGGGRGKLVLIDLSCRKSAGFVVVLTYRCSRSNIKRCC